MAEGRVLEIGIGSGLNLPFYIPGRIDCLWGVEPSGQLRAIAEKKAAEHFIDFSFAGTSGENILLEDRSADTIVVTFTLCTIPDIGKALMEMYRVLKPGGKLLFCEHGRAPDKHVARWQERLNPFWKQCSGGCNLDRDIPGLINESGFEIATLNVRYMTNIRLVGYNYHGVALKRMIQKSRF